MSITKRVWIERDPAYEAIREKAAKEAWSYVAEFSYRLPTRKFKTVSSKRKVDRIWDWSLSDAIREIDAECVYVNSGVFFRTAEERDLVNRRATELWTERES